MLSNIKAFIEERLGWSKRAHAALDVPIPGGARWGLVLGAVLAWLFVLEFTTGLALMTVYAPSSQTAWASTFYIEHHFSFGGLVRGTHYWAAQVMLVVVVLHLFQVIIAGAYRRPREVNWWLGLLLAGLVFGFAHTGALLPWDQKAYWTTQVEASITGSMPVVGHTAQLFMQGGRELGTLSITRLYAVHVGLLPILMFLLVAAHIALFRRFGPTPPSGGAAQSLPSSPTAEDVASAQKSGLRVDNFWPSQAVRDAIAAFLVVLGVMYLGKRLGAPLEAPADPAGEYPARPEWYLLGLFQFRHMLPPKLEIVATAIVPGILTAFIAGIPFLDRSATRALRPRLWVLASVFLIIAGVGAITLKSMHADARDPGFQRARALVERRATRARELASAGIPPTGPLEMVRNDPQVRPGELWDEHCGSCHAPVGVLPRDPAGQRTRARGPALQGFGTRGWLRALLTHPDANDLFGRTEIHEMPPQARRLGEDGLAAVIEYLISQSIEPGDPPADPALVTRGDQVFHARCTVCHQGAGDTTETDAADRTAPDLTGWASRAWIRDQILNPAAPQNYGTLNHMPAFGDRLQGRELEFVVDYVRGLRRAPPPPVVQPPPRAPTPES